jgi:hypothetical protein
MYAIVDLGNSFLSWIWVELLRDQRVGAMTIPDAAVVLYKLLITMRAYIRDPQVHNPLAVTLELSSGPSVLRLWIVVGTASMVLNSIRDHSGMVRTSYALYSDRVWQGQANV